MTRPRKQKQTTLNGSIYIGSEKISVAEYVDIINFFDKHLLGGAEIERVVPMQNSTLAGHLNTTTASFSENRSSSDTIQSRYRSARVRNPYNVTHITSDGTFEYGNEIIYAGNNESFEWNYDHLKKIEDKLTQLRAVEYSPKTSTHLSFLTAYNMPLPPIILKNIHNICRAFSSGLLYLCGGDKHVMIRSNAEQYSHPKLSLNPIDIPIHELIVHCSKYSSVNLAKNNLTSGNNPLLDGLFVEFRAVDGIRVPSVIAALLFLHRAIIYKAVECSTQGILSVEAVDDWSKNKGVTMNAIDRIPLTEDALIFAKNNALKLLAFVDGMLKKLDKQAQAVLYKIVQCPAWMMAKDRKSLTYADNAYFEKARKLNAQENKLLSSIITADIKTDTFKEWKITAAESMGCSVRYIEKMLINIVDTTRMDFVFDCEQRTMRVN